MTMRADFALPAVEESSLRYDGWRVTAVCFVVAMFCWGFGLYSHGIYLAELQHRFGWSVALISSATTAYYLLTASLVVFVSDAILRFGPRRIFLTGTCCLSSAVALLAFIAAPWQLYLVYLIMAAGFRITELKTFYVRGPRPMTYTYQGAAETSDLHDAT